LDVAATELYKDGAYHLKRDNKTLSSEEMVAWLTELVTKYPVASIEDGLGESDWAAWQSFTQQHGSKLQIVGDDLLVTNPTIVKEAVQNKACNALLVKLNQIGTLSLTLEAMKLSQDAGWNVVPSHRSGETEDTFIAHLAVGTGAGQIKTGAPSRTDRTAKYNELLRITETI
jgi:enolase